ncbi:hypothetical protein M1146_06695 [Patescibacteria group bacterium]|nr:hypothetical protein [Patescibacteria group bacterium]
MKANGFGHYYLGNCCDYASPNEGISESGLSEADNEIALIKKKWDKDIIPTMYTAMSRAGFTEMETEQYMYVKFIALVLISL